MSNRQKTKMVKDLKSVPFEAEQLTFSRLMVDLCKNLNHFAKIKGNINSKLTKFKSLNRRFDGLSVIDRAN